MDADVDIPAIEPMHLQGLGFLENIPLIIEIKRLPSRSLLPDGQAWFNAMTDLVATAKDQVHKGHFLLILT